MIFFFHLINTRTNENAEPFSTKTDRIKSCLRTGRQLKEHFENGMDWTAKTETFENTTLVASVFGERGAVRKCINVHGA